MNIVNNMKWMLRVSASAAIVMIAVGCTQSKNDGMVHGEQFVPDDSERSVSAFNGNEAAKAAHADATLRSYHFDGDMLNSLGEERLDLILRSGESPTPLTLFVDLPTDDAKTTKRRDAIIAYLKDRGLTDNQIVLKSGPNPDVNSPVTPLIASSAAGAAAGATPTASAH